MHILSNRIITNYVYVYRFVMSNRDPKEEIKKEILSRIARIKEDSDRSDHVSMEEEWRDKRDPGDSTFFKSPKWQEHLVNINKLWNIYSDEGGVRTGILHEINEGWTLQQLFDSEEFRYLISLIMEGKLGDGTKSVQKIRDSRKGDKAVTDVLRALYEGIRGFAESQREFNAKLVRSINTMFELLENVLNVQKTFNAETVRFINEYIGIEDPESQHVFLQERKLLNDRLEAFLRVLERRYQSSELKIHREVKNLAELVHTFFSMFEQYWDGQLPPFKTEVKAPRKKIDDIEYTFFEDLWRGDLQDVKEKQRKYLKFFDGKNNVLDFGCGRGEFLELLAEAGIDSFGVEENEEMVSICREKGLNVVCQGGLVYLHRISDQSLGGIFISHVIEHLSREDIMKLLNLCSRKLESGGIIVLETINPCNYKAYFENFIKDFTHKTPIHHETLKFILEMNGYRIMEMLKLSELRTEEKLKTLDTGEDGMDPAVKSTYNENIERLNALLFGNQDYAIIASK